VTVLEAIQKSTEFLTKKGVDSPRLQTELLLAHLLKLPRMKLYLNFERVLSPAEMDALRELVKRRGQREPLQYITGSTSFCGLEIEVNRLVLVPRPETEMLAELGWEFLNWEGRRAGDSNSGTATRRPSQIDFPTALDFGTGSGCIAIALAVKCPAARIVALDISAEALALAKENAVRNKVAERIEFLNADSSSVASPHQFDLVISNPPYIPSLEIETLQPEVKDFEPRLALDGGADGLVFFRRFAVEAAAWLKPGGKIMLEFSDGQAEAIRKIFENEKWIVEAVKEDYSHRARILVARRQTKI
jgi:release factor glutamine methyltransferase